MCKLDKTMPVLLHQIAVEVRQGTLGVDARG